MRKNSYNLNGHQIHPNTEIAEIDRQDSITSGTLKTDASG
jgi:hypothetical protein